MNGDALADGPEETCAHAARYLSEAGWIRSSERARLCLSAERRGTCASLALRVDASAGHAALGITLLGAGQGRHAELRIRFSTGPDLLGFLCLLTGSQDDLCEDSADEWIDAVVELCPDTYAVISTEGAPEVLASVVRRGAPRTLH